MYADISPVVLTAAVKGLEKQIKGTKLPTGVHEIDCTFSIRIKGALEKGEDTERQMPPAIHWPTLLTLLCNRAGLGRDGAKTLIAELAQKSLVIGGEDPEISPRLKDRLLDACTAIDDVKACNRVTTPYAGATKFLGTVACE